MQGCSLFFPLVKIVLLIRIQSPVNMPPGGLSYIAGSAAGTLFFFPTRRITVRCFSFVHRKLPHLPDVDPTGDFKGSSAVKSGELLVGVWIVLPTFLFLLLS